MNEFARKGRQATINQIITNQKRAGFTLLELLVVVGILAALVALALPFYQDYINQSKLVAAQADLQTFQKALALYDQREPIMFKEEDLRSLIGTYLQDYRIFDKQENPLDPWGNEYEVNASAGVVLSWGPNGKLDSEDIAKRKASGDDLIVTWKPDFFLSSARRISARVLEINFSRKVGTLASGSVNIPAGCTSIQQVSASVYRLIYPASVTLPLTGSGNVEIVGSVASQDGRPLSVSKNPNGEPANKITY